MNKRMSVAAKCAIAFWLVPAALAQPSRTTIQDVLYKADGTRMNGLAVISWNSFQAADGTNITQSSVTVAIMNGNFQVQLAPTTNAAQAVSYSVQYNTDGKAQFEETWAVPPSATPLRIQDVRSTAGRLQPPPATQQIHESDVIGLTADLLSRPVKGPGFGFGRSARINSAGAIEAVIGSASDCVRTDGTPVACGASTVGPSFVDEESPAGVVDGVNTTFTLANAPNPASSLMLYRNGLLQKTGMDYSLSGATIQLVAGSGLQPADTLLASYRVAGVSVAPVVFVDGETPGGAMDGINASFTLAGTPNPAVSLALFRNGLLQKAGADYSLSGATIQFLPASIPQTGDSVVANYRQ